MTRRGRDDRGSATLEMVILGPAFALVIGLLVLGGRVALAEQAVQGAASEAARAVSLGRGADTGAAEEAARAFLTEQGVGCEQLAVDFDVAAKGSRPGTAGLISTSVQCDVLLGDLALPGVPGSRRMTATATSPIDVYRER